MSLKSSKPALLDGDPKAVPVVVELLRDEDSEVRAIALDALGNTGSQAEEAIPAVVEMLDEDSYLRVLASETLVKIGPQGMAALVKAIQSKPARCMLCRRALRNLGPAGTECVPELTAAMKHQNADVRRLMCEALLSIGPEARDAVPALIEATQDSNSAVRSVAAACLGSIGAKQAVPALRVLISDTDPMCRFWAANALWEIEHRRDVVVPVLIELREGLNGHVCRQARELLEEIEDEPEQDVDYPLKE
jgi:HEAT repeat protein